MLKLFTVFFCVMRSLSNISSVSKKCSLGHSQQGKEMPSVDGISVGPREVNAIKDFPTPTTLTDLHSFMSLVSQLAEFKPNIATATQPLCTLMRAFMWNGVHDKAFCHTKTALLTPPVFAPFDPDLPVILQTNAFILMAFAMPSYRTMVVDTFV